MLLRLAVLLIALAVPVPLQTGAHAAKPAAAQKPAAQAPAVPSTADLPDGRAIIDKFVKAIGGREAVLSHKSEHAVGSLTVSQSGMTGTFEMYGAADPNRALQKMTIAGVGDIMSGFDGTHGWSIDPMTGPRLQVGNELDETRLDSDFYAELRDPKTYPLVKTIERGEFEGHTCYKVSLTNIDGATDFDYYDVTSGLKVGSVNTRDTMMGKVTATSIVGDYKKFGNILQPTTLVQRAMEVEQKVTLKSLEYDTVDPSVFELPAPIKALIK